jgi:hypothetical protein
VVVFIDDLRGSGPTVELTWFVSRVIAARLQYLGMQDAARKRRPPTTQPGAWAGGVFKTTDKNVTCMVTQEKWDKARGMIAALQAKMEPSQDGGQMQLNYKELEVTRGYLVHWR